MLSRVHMPEPKPPSPKYFRRIEKYPPYRLMTGLPVEDSLLTNSISPISASSLASVSSKSSIQIKNPSSGNRVNDESMTESSGRSRQLEEHAMTPKTLSLPFREAAEALTPAARGSQGSLAFWKKK